MSNITIENIEESDLRIALWKQKSGHTKKSICEQLKIKYNTARLDKILVAFQEALVRQEELKKLNKKKVFSDDEQKIIAKRYLEVGSMSKIAEEYYISAAKVKSILISQQVPIKSRKSVLVDHIEQDLNTPFNIGDFVFSKIHQTKCEVVKKYDEEYVEYLKDGSIKTVDNPYVEDGDVDTINFSTYWILADGTNIGLLQSVEAQIKNIENVLIQIGQEFYRVKINNENESYFGFCKRGDLYKV